MTPDQRLAQQQYVAAMTVSGRDLLVATGVFVPAELTTKPNTGIRAARSIAAGMDAWWPTGGESR